MTRRIPALVLIAALCGSCDPLVVRPGGDFAIEVLTPQPIVVREQVAPFALSFKVHGCDHFTASLQQPATTDEGEIRHALECAMQADGSCLAYVPPRWAWVDSWCQNDELSPAANYVGLTITCTDDGRSDSAWVKVTAIPAWRTGWIGRSADEILPIDGLSAILALGSGWATVLDPANGIAADEQLSVEPGDPHSAAALGDTLYVSPGCGYGTCGWKVISDPDLPGVQYGFETTWLALFDYSGHSLRKGGAIEVPYFSRMALDGDHLVLLSEFTDRVLITRLFGDGSQTYGVWRHPGRPSKLVRLAGGLAFLAFDKNTGQAFLAHVDDPSFAQPVALAGTGDIAVVELSPDGERYVVLRDDGAWMGPITGGATNLDIDAGSSPRNLGVAWFAGLLALWTYERAAAFDADGAKRFDYVPDATGPGLSAPDIRGGAAVGDYLALTTYTGVRVLDAQGNVAAGLDPLPCHLLPAAPAVAVDANHVAVAAGMHAYFLDLP